MKPFKASIPIYAESEEEVKTFERAFYDFVNAKRNQGIAVTADKVTEAINRFQNNPFLNKYLR